MNCLHSAFETYIPSLKERTNANIFPGGEDKRRSLTNPGIVSDSSMFRCILHPGLSNVSYDFKIDRPMHKFSVRRFQPKTFSETTTEHHPAFR